MTDLLFTLAPIVTQGRRLKPITLNKTTPYQKKIMLVVLYGGAITKCGKFRYRAVTKKREPLYSFTVSTFLKLKNYLRETKLGWVLDGRKIMKLRRNTWVKQYYLQLKKLS